MQVERKEVKDKIIELFDKQYPEFKKEFDNEELMIEKVYKNGQLIFKNTSKSSLIFDLVNIATMDGVKESLKELNVCSNRNSKKILTFKL